MTTSTTKTATTRYCEGDGAPICEECGYCTTDVEHLRHVRDAAQSDTEQPRREAQWKLTAYRLPDGSLQGRPYVSDGTGNPYVCEGFRSDYSVERLEYAIRCVNAHESLIVALEQVADRLHAATQWKTADGQSVPMPTLIEMRHAENKLREALKQAKDGK